MIAIKKYANRRLYNVTLQLYHLERAGRWYEAGKIHISDAKTGQDLTRPTLVQVILECEQRPSNVAC